MGMNIKNKEAHLLARELAALTGESITSAVLVSLKERLARLKNANRESVSEQLMAIGKDCAKRLKPQIRKIDHGTMLYDNDGLPK